MNDRAGIVVQVRMDSTRLPGKALRPIGDVPLLHRLILRVAQSTRCPKVVVATSREPSDDPIVELCARLQVPVFRGSKHDVIDRFVGAARTFGLDEVVRVTADNPLTDPRGIDALVERFEQADVDIVHTAHKRGWPYGTGSEMFRTQALERCAAELAAVSEREEPFTWMRRHPDRFSCARVDAPDHLLRPALRLTIDYPEDLALMNALHETFGDLENVPLGDVVGFLDRHPEIAQINSARHVGFSE